MIAIKRMTRCEFTLRVVLPIIVIIGSVIYLTTRDDSYVPGSQKLEEVQERTPAQEGNMLNKNETVKSHQPVGVVTPQQKVVGLVDYIMEKEGFLRVPKRDTNGTMIIGHGTSVSFARKCGWMGCFMTRKTAKRILEVRLAQEANEVYSMVSGLATAPLNVQTAVRSMYYNGGPGLVGPNCRRFIAAKDWASLAQEIALGHNPKGLYGLVVRRFEEASMVARLPMRMPKDMREFEWVKAELYPL